MRHKPVDGSAAMAQGVDVLLRRFRGLDTKMAASAAGPVRGSTGGGPIEPTYFIASAYARPDIKAVADFVCSGEDDQVEIQTAIDLLQNASYSGGIVQLSQGYFNLSDWITISGEVWLRGTGPESTHLWSDGAAPTNRYGLIALTGDFGGVSDLSASADVDGYDVTIYASKSGITPGVISNCQFTNNFSEGDDGYACTSIGNNVHLVNCFANGQALGIYMWGARSKVKDCVVNQTSTVNGTDGSGIYIAGAPCWYPIIEGCTVLDSVGPGIHILNAHDGIITGNTSLRQLKVGTSAERNLIDGNYIWGVEDHAITIDGGTGTGANDNQISNNYVRMTDTASKIYDGVHLLGNADRNRIFGNYLLSDLLLGAGGRYAVNISAATCNDNVVELNYVSPNWTDDYVDSGTGTGLNLLESPLTTKGDLVVFDTAETRLPVGTDTHVLTADAAEASGVKWAVASGSGGLDLTAKGQLHTFDTDDAALTVGADGEALFADSGEATGLNWRDIVEADVSDLAHYTSADFDTDLAASDLSGADLTAIHDDTASEISAITAKATPVSGDFLIIEDSAAANAKKSITIGDLPSSGGTPLTTKGDILGFDTADERIPVGTDDFVLTADATQALGVKWAAVSSGSSPLTTKGDLYGYDTGDARLAVGTDTHVLTADSGETLGVKWAAPSATADGSKATSMMLGGM